MNTETVLNFEEKLSTLIKSHAITKKYLPGDIILSKNMTLNKTAFIISGLLKVHLEQNYSSLLLYHISPKNNSILTLMNMTNDTSIPVSITAIEESTLLWVPDSKISEWDSQYLSLKKLIIYSCEYNIGQMISTTRNLMIHSLKERLYNYLRTKASIYNLQDLKISRTEIAIDLNTSKATISRAIKRLENENKIIGKPRSITLID